MRPHRLGRVNKCAKYRIGDQMVWNRRGGETHRNNLVVNVVPDDNEMVSIGHRDQTLWGATIPERDSVAATPVKSRMTVTIETIWILLSDAMR